jgi:hypothetical protein
MMKKKMDGKKQMDKGKQADKAAQVNQTTDGKKQTRARKCRFLGSHEDVLILELGSSRSLLMRRMN